MEKRDNTGALERSQDEKLGQAISQAMREIKRQETERKTPAPGKILNYTNFLKR